MNKRNKIRDQYRMYTSVRVRSGGRKTMKHMKK